MKRPVLALDVDPSDSAAMVAEFRQLVPGGAYSFALDPGGAIAQRYGVRALEESVVASPAGALAFHNTTPPTVATLELELERVAAG